MQVRAAQQACAASGARLWVNDFWRDAVAVGAYGVHLGQEDLAALTDGSEAAWSELNQLARSGLRLGVSTHTYGELAAALAVRPSYISIGPVSATQSKSVTAASAGPASTTAKASAPIVPKGLEGVTAWRSLIPSDVPLVAIGGIALQQAPGVLAAGADGIAVISAVVKAPDRASAVREWLSLWHQ
jgi:hydroxymethylpyrimidine kinase/phosphomethylpyrimidine kinase/thiamine-phosphate diphosphorylase